MPKLLRRSPAKRAPATKAPAAAAPLVAAVAAAQQLAAQRQLAAPKTLLAALTPRRALVAERGSARTGYSRRSTALVQWTQQGRAERPQRFTRDGRVTFGGSGADWTQTGLGYVHCATAALDSAAVVVSCTAFGRRASLA